MLLHSPVDDRQNTGKNTSCGNDNKSFLKKEAEMEAHPREKNCLHTGKYAILFVQLC